MTVTYASFQQNLNISGTSTITKKPGAASTIKDMVSTKPNELYIDNNGDVRYYGKNPNNYVTFNNELWRIIGVLDDMVKIIRSTALPDILTANGETIGNESCWKPSPSTPEYCENLIQWSMNGTNNWTNATLYRYLNGAYYNSISTDSKNMIAQETWYLGGPTTSNYNTLTTSEYYAIERSSNVYSGNPTQIKQNIGLLYVSDLFYSGGSKYMGQIPGLGFETYLSGFLYWFQTPLSDNNNKVLSIEFMIKQDPRLAVLTAKATDGELHDFHKYSGLPVIRPTLYLKENVEIIDGSGSQSDPFILK